MQNIDGIRDDEMVCFGKIMLTKIVNDDSTSILVPARARDDVAVLKELINLRIQIVHVVEDVSETFPHVQIFQERLLSHRQAVLLSSEEPQ